MVLGLRQLCAGVVVVGPGGFRSSVVVAVVVVAAQVQG